MTNGRNSSIDKNPSCSTLSSLEKNSSSKKGFNFLFLIPVVLLAVVVYEGVLYYQKISQKESEVAEKISPSPAVKEPVVTPTIKKLSNLEIAKITLDWLDKQRDERGVYNISRSCDTYADKSKNDCSKVSKSGTSGHEGLTAIFARFITLMKTQEKKDKEILLKDLEIYGNRDKLGYIQNDFWNCKLMYELWKSDLFTEAQKKLIENICWQSIYHSLPGIEYKKVDGRNRDKVEKAIPNFSFNKPEMLDPEIEKLFSKYLSIFIAYPSDYIAKYRWKNEKEDLELAKYYFSNLASFFRSQPERFNARDNCLLGISSLDLFDETQKKDYRDFAVNTLGEKDISNGYLQPVCGIFLGRLYQQTKDETYSTKEKMLIENLKENYFDYQGYKNFTVGDGGFFSVGEDGGLGLGKYTRENGLVIMLLDY